MPRVGRCWPRPGSTGSQENSPARPQKATHRVATWPLALPHTSPKGVQTNIYTELLTAAQFTTGGQVEAARGPINR